MDSGQGQSPQTILVTGGCGYLGAQLLKDISEDKRLGPVRLRILDNLQAGHYESLMDLSEGGSFEFIEGDILDPAAVRMATRGVKTVIHLAAMVRTPMSFDHPIWVEQVNHWGTARLVETCLTQGVARFIYASSAAVYGPGGPFTEESEPKPLGPYAQSKFQAEKAVFGAASRGMDCSILRFGTIYGRGPVTRYDAVVNRFAFLAGVCRPLTIHGDGGQRRPFVHVRDASDAIIFTLANKELGGGQIFNVVSEIVTIEELVAAIKAVKPDVRVHFADQDVLTHQSFIVNNQKILDVGWSPKYTHQDGLRELLSKFKGLESINLEIPDLD